MAALRAQAVGYEAADASVVAVAGDLIVVALRERDGSTMSIADDVNGAYTLAVTRAITVARAGIWYFRNSGGGTLTFTVTGGSIRDYNVSVWSGMQDVAVDTTNNAGGTATSHAHGSLTPSAQAVVVSAMGSGSHGGVTPHSGFTALTIHASATAPVCASL